MKFVSLSQSLVCPICQDLYLNPVIINACNHTFCLNCLLQALEIDTSCPLCRKHIGNTDFHPNLALETLISELLVYCSYREQGCPEIITKEQLSTHVAECKYAPVECEFSLFGCDFSGFRSDYIEHAAGCPFHKMKVYLRRTEDRIAALEKLVEQHEVIKTLRKKPSDISIAPRSNSIVSLGGGLAQSPTQAWPYGDIACHKTFMSTRTGVSSLACLDTTLFAGGYDGSIQLLNMTTGQVFDTVQGHRLSVWSIIVDPVNKELYTASSDESIKIWDIKADTPSFMASLDSNQGGKIYSLLLKNRLLLAASSKGGIRIWNLDSRKCIGELKGHTGGVNSIKLVGNKLISASSDKSIKVWDLSTQTCTKTISNLQSEVLDISVCGNMLFGSTYDANITAYDLNDFSCTAVLSGHRWEVWRLQAYDMALFSGSHDHTIKRWDIRRMESDLTLDGHRGYIHSLIADDNGLMSGCADKTIKLWR